MEMKMVAVQDISMAEDLTPPIPPLSYALHYTFLHSHCSLCFSSLSTHSNHHHHQHHHHLSIVDLHLLNSLPSTYNTSDLRIAPHLFLTHAPGPRIFVLLTNCHKLMSSDIFDELQIGDKALDAGRRMGLGSNGEVLGRDEEGVVSTEAALCAVVMNSVEVVDGEGHALGIMIYGTDFSWINHSCSPNACYRFEFVLENDVVHRLRKVSELRIMPFSDQPRVMI